MRQIEPLLYRHRGTALLRAAVTPLTDTPGTWPDFDDPDAARDWLYQIWSRPGFSEAVTVASADLAARVDTAVIDPTLSARQLYRLTITVLRYLLRSIGRPTPFGLFAGVAPVRMGAPAAVSWGSAHRPNASVDTLWLDAVLTGLEAVPALLEALDVVFTDLATRRGGRVEVPRGTDRVTVRYTAAVRTVWHAAATPVRFADLVDKLTAEHPGCEANARTMLTALVAERFLITSLRAPATVIDPLGHVLAEIDRVVAATLPESAEQLAALRAVHGILAAHNAHPADPAAVRTAAANRMWELSGRGRTPLAVHLALDAEVSLPASVAEEAASAAGALLRLTNQPTGEPAWRDYYVAFAERYGTGTVVPVRDVLHPDAGLGCPAGMPGSVQGDPVVATPARDQRLLGLAWETLADGHNELVVTDERIDALSDGLTPDGGTAPPHVEVGVTLLAPDTAAIDRGDYLLVVSPARAAGTLTGRFTFVAEGTGLPELYGGLPPGTAGALQAQVSFIPLFPHAENVGRTPLYLPHVLPVGEHRRDGDERLHVDDLAVTAVGGRLYLVSLARRQVVEPQVINGLDLSKQAPPLVRFLTAIPRAGRVRWHEFDWGEAASGLPFLPRVRYRKAILSPARWRLTADELLAGSRPEQQAALDRWRSRWSCPHVVDLKDGSNTLRLDLTVPAHVALLVDHVQRREEAVLLETLSTAADLGWIGGHTHVIAVPLMSDRPPAPSPALASAPLIRNRSHGQLPADLDADWLHAKLFTHPARIDELLALHLPALLDVLPEGTPFWFLRYRSPLESDHLRLRIATPDIGAAAAIPTVTTWAAQLRGDGLCGRLAFDTYYPEVGRYGEGDALDAATAVFAADSAVAIEQLRLVPSGLINTTALVAVGMVELVRGFLGGDHAEAMRWLTDRSTPDTSTDRNSSRQAIAFVHDGPPATWPATLITAWHDRAAAAAAYGRVCPLSAEGVIESLLHMHHNRVVGIDRDHEDACRRLARQIAVSWLARNAA
ncbi:lantibiotic dehydratase [Cryptosporangium minutisporangium]|uniref:Lantibiotic dehydratase n=1 Tax=Cryptosporangium minutisporangium TaxID=113569 RepID=A0ABP6T657_9ACTN